MRLFYSGIFAVILHLFCGTASAAGPKIVGRLTDGDGYQVLATDAEGNSVGSKSEKFSARPTFSVGTLALVDPGGNAAGPIVLGIQTASGKIISYAQAVNDGICDDSGTQAIASFKLSKKKKSGKKGAGNINLGSVVVVQADGFAYTTKVPSKKQLSFGSLSPVDGACVPQGAGGTLGLSPGSSALAARTVAASGDTDSDSDGIADEKDVDDDNDGAADTFDIDLNGDGILDFYQIDPDGNFVGAEEEEEEDGEEDFFSFVFSNLQVDLDKTVNLYAGSFSQSAIDEFVKSYLVLTMGIPGKGEFEVELDCDGLSYCTPGGTGNAADGPGTMQSREAFPDAFDDDGDTFGRIDEVASENQIGDFFLAPNATTSEIKPGNVLTQLFEVKGKEVRRPLLLQFVFSTVPAIKSLLLGENNPTTTEITYPISPGAPGGNGICFSYNRNLGHKVTFTINRPQRLGIQAAGEAQFMDMGRLRTTISVQQDQNTSPAICPVSSYTTSDPNISFYEGNGFDVEVGLLDSKGDTPFDSAAGSNTYSFTLDLKACTGAESGKTFIILKQRTPRNDNAGQKFCIERI